MRLKSEINASVGVYDPGFFALSWVKSIGQLELEERPGSTPATAH